MALLDYCAVVTGDRSRSLVTKAIRNDNFLNFPHLKVKTVKGLGKRGNFPLRIIYMCNRTSNQLRERCTGENCTSASIF